MSCLQVLEEGQKESEGFSPLNSLLKSQQTSSLIHIKGGLDRFFFPLSFYSVDWLRFGWVRSLLICNYVLVKQIKLLEQIQLQNVLLQSRADTGFCNIPLILPVYLGGLRGL